MPGSCTLLGGGYNKDELCTETIYNMEQCACPPKLPTSFLEVNTWSVQMDPQSPYDCQKTYTINLEGQIHTSHNAMDRGPNNIINF